MVDSSVSETTQLLRAWAEGDERALEALIPRVYRELRRLAGHCLKNERPERTTWFTKLTYIWLTFRDWIGSIGTTSLRCRPR